MNDFFDLFDEYPDDLGPIVVPYTLPAGLAEARAQIRRIRKLPEKFHRIAQAKSATISSSPAAIGPPSTTRKRASGTGGAHPRHHLNGAPAGGAGA